MHDELRRTKSLLEEAYQLTNTDIDRARQLAEDVRQVLAKNSETHSIEKIQTDIVIAEWYRQRGYYAESVVSFLGAIEAYENFEEDDWLILALYRLGMVYTLLNYHSEAIEIHLRQYNTAKKFANHTEMGNALRRIGWGYHELQQNKRAIENHLQSLEHFELVNDITGIAGVYNNLALLYQYRNELPIAIDYAHKAVELFEEAGYLRGETLVHGTLTSILTDAGDLENAKFHAERNLALAKELKIHHTVIHAHLNMGKLYLHMNNVDKAFEYYQSALELAHQQQDMVGQKLCHQHLAEFYSRTRHYKKAFDHQQKFHELEIQGLKNASDARFEIQSILHQTRQAQAELMQQKLLRQEERHHYEQLTRMKDELISTASHDLKNPLATIQLMTYLLSRQLKEAENPRILDIIQQINDSAERMRDLIVDVLDLARLETGKTLELQKVSLADYLQSILSEFKLIAEQKDIQIEFDNPSEDVSIAIDPSQIQQVLRNLLSNAVKYSKAGDKVNVSIQLEDAQIIIKVQDTGIGIPDADLPYIFERFYRVKDKAHQAVEGTGLGLAICKSIVEQHQGSITVESSIGVGTTFFVSIPIAG